MTCWAGRLLSMVVLIAHISFEFCMFLELSKTCEVFISCALIPEY